VDIRLLLEQSVNDVLELEGDVVMVVSIEVTCVFLAMISAFSSSTMSSDAIVVSSKRKSMFFALGSDIFLAMDSARSKTLMLSMFDMS
jgi:hypothetical protein